MPGRTIDQILDEIAELDEAVVTKALNNTEIDVIKTFRSKNFAAGKKEGSTSSKKLDAEKTELEGKVAELSEELKTLKDKTPDLAAEKKKLEDKFAADKKKLEDKNAELSSLIVTKERSGALEKFSKFLTGNPEDLARTHKGLTLGDVNDEYASLVLQKKYEDRIVVENGVIVDVLKPGEQTGFDAPTIDEKLALLAAEVRKTVPTTFITPRNRSGSGSGLRPIGGGTPNPNASTDEEVKTVTDKKLATGNYSI